MGRRFVALAVTLAAVVLPAATAPAQAAQRSQARLARFDSCAELQRYGRAAVRRTRGSVGVPTRVGAAFPVALGRRLGGGGDQFTDAIGPVAVSAPAAGREAAPGTSTTNVQEEGVDEPDLVKSDGRTLFALVGSTLHAFDVTGAAPVLQGSLALDGAPAELLVRGDRVLVIGAGPGFGEVQLVEVDVSDLRRPAVARTLTVSGAYVSARLTGGTARVVIAAPPEPDASVPTSTIRSRITRREFPRPLVACRAVRHPARFSGLGLLTVLTVDLDRGLIDVDRDAVMAGAQVVYGSQRSLYVASQRWVPGVAEDPEAAARLTTEVHRFDASAPGATSYASSGTVIGSVLNQFSLSEHDGALRVATTDTPPWLPGAAGAAGESESAVTVLRERDGRLETVGRVGGLGRGERIYAVRFLADRGYVVTFRQVDPLYVVDLADPAAPRVAGELKIPGFSTYLHPLGDGLLLGVGRDATERGQALDVQASLFDVSDPARPARLDTHAIGTVSEVEGDHHAFLWSAGEELAVVPFATYGPEQAAGARVLRVRRTGIGERGQVAHEAAFPAPVRRALVAGERLITVSDAGVATSRLDTLAPLGFVPFTAP